MRSRLTQQKYNTLLKNLAAKGSLAVAFSGGVDSSFLLKAAQEALGEKVLAITVQAESVSTSEIDDATVFCRSHGIRHRILPMSQLAIEGFGQNPPNRCYLCKKAIFSEILQVAEAEGFAVVCEGTNATDRSPRIYRPGIHALEELQIYSPLYEAELRKEEIRELSKDLGLPTWDKPSISCLATRFPYGEELTEEKMRMVEKAEAVLAELGFAQRRVRVHGDIARIEVETGELEKAVREREKIVDSLTELGFVYVTLDLEGFRSGSMDL